MFNTVIQRLALPMRKGNWLSSKRDLDLLTSYLSLGLLAGILNQHGLTMLLQEVPLTAVSQSRLVW